MHLDGAVVNNVIHFGNSHWHHANERGDDVRRGGLDRYTQFEFPSRLMRYRPAEPHEGWIKVCSSQGSRSVLNRSMPVFMSSWLYRGQALNSPSKRFHQGSLKSNLLLMSR